MTDTEILVNRFIKLRCRLNKSQRDVSAASRLIAVKKNDKYHYLFNTQISMLENKTRKPTIDLLAKCFRALGYKLVVVPTDAKVYWRMKGHKI